MRWFAVGCAAVVAFDTIAAWTADRAEFDYASLWPISLAIYAVSGFLAARDTRSTKIGSLAGATVALVDATVGWAVSWIIGPGAPPRDARGPASVVAAATFVVATGAVLGLGAGWAGRRAAQGTRPT